MIGRVSRALCLVAFAAGPLYAQDADSIARQLSANDPKSVAWGGYLAGEHRVRAAVPHLIAALDSSRLRQAGREWKAARFAVLDALILLDAQPPADLLVRYYKEHREQVLILLSEPRAGRDDILLKLLKRESGLPWYAIAGLLLETRAAGFGAGLIEGLRLRLDVSVVDGESRYYRGIGAGGGACHYGIYPAPGFPPIATYSLWNGAVRGATILAEGPHPVYYTRKSSPADWVPGGGVSFMIQGPSADDRLEYINKLLQHWLPIKGVEEITLNWSTAAQMQQQVRKEATAHRNDVASRFKQMLNLAIAAKVLNAEEALHLAPAIDVRVLDQRRDTSIPLPEVSR